MLPGYPFVNLQVSPRLNLSKNQRVISWKLDKAFHDSLPYKFTLEISETPDFSQLIEQIVSTDTYYFIDNFENKQAFSTTRIYRIKLETNDNTYFSTTLNFDAERATKHKYLIAQEIIRKEALRMRKYTGFNGWILKRKSYGVINMDVVDEVTGVVISNKPGTYGTGIVGDYHKPLAVWYSMEESDPEQDDRIQTPNGVAEDFSQRVRFLGFPDIEPKDILVTGDNLRLNIDGTKTTRFPGTTIPIIQRAVVKEIPYTDDIYKIEING